MRFFTNRREPVELRFAQFPAGEWRLDTPIGQDLVVEASGLEPDFWIKTALLSVACCNAERRLKLALPYLPAARDDHLTSLGAHAYASLIDALFVDEVHVFDPHSPIMVGTLNTKVIVHEPTEAVVASIHGVGGILCPDKGARHRAQAVADRLKVPIIEASKVRTFETGKLSGFHCPPLPEIEGDWLVVDDICDGGGTFVGLAKASGLPRDRLQLWVSHAVFSGRAQELTDYYRWVTTTNSFLSLTDVPCTRVPVHTYMKGLYDQD